MAGLYLHIPFCREACHYCDFHFSIAVNHLPALVEALENEIISRKNEASGEQIETIYLGGGTPSILKPEQIKRLMESIRDNFEITWNPEITLEANPDDLDPDYLSGIRTEGINRLSIGVQSFHNDELALLNRTHSSRQAAECIENAHRAGFDNLSIDLIYGIPGSDHLKWEKTLARATALSPKHVSAYHLTYEKGSVLDYRLTKQKIHALDEETSLEMFNSLIDHLDSKGYVHYEISNFARNGKYSKHNLAYWTGKKYLGFGPSAHSYDGKTRRWNLPRNSGYIRALREGNKYWAEEVCDMVTRYHDYLLTGLRARQGIDKDRILSEWGPEFLSYLEKHASPFLKSEKLLEKGNRLTLSREGMFISDYIISALFMQR